MRIADRFTSLYNNDDLKLFQGNSPLFQNLPPEVLRALLYKFSDLMEQEFSVITKFDPLRVPNAIELFVPDVPKEQTKADDETINLFGDPTEENLESDILNKVQTGPTLPLDEIVPEEPENSKERIVPLEEQEFQDIQDEDDLEDDLDELLYPKGEVSNSKDVSPDLNEVNESDDEEPSDGEEEPGMRLRSGKIKEEPAQKTVRFRNT